MRLKGRYISDRQLQNIEGIGIAEIDRGNGVTELKRNIDALTMFPVMDKRAKKVEKKEDHRLILASLIVAAFLAGVSFMGLFLFPIILQKFCGPIFIISLAWLAFLLWVNRE